MNRTPLEKLTEIDRENIIRAIRSSEQFVVWLSDRGAIVLARDGSVTLIKAVGQDYFKDGDCAMFINGVTGLSSIRASFPGSAAEDQLVHERLWSEAQKGEKVEKNIKPH